MMKPTRHELLRMTLLGLALAAMILLIAGISQVELAPGLPFASIWAFLIGDFMGIPRGALAGGSSPMGQLLVDIVRAAFFIALAAFPFGVILVIIDPEQRKRVLRTMVLIAIIAFLLSLVVENQGEEEGVEPEPPVSAVDPGEDMMPAPPLTEEEFDPLAISPWVVWGTSLGTGLVLAIIIVVVINQIRKMRAENETPLTEIARRARKALDDIEGGGDLRDTILRCYAEMSRIVREELGVKRDKDITAREFTDYLVAVDLPRKDVVQLTRLFEKARYSGAAPTVSDEREAVASLQAIIDACLVAK